jgi:hypothetical protein
MKPTRARRESTSTRWRAWRYVRSANQGDAGSDERSIRSLHVEAQWLQRLRSAAIVMIRISRLYRDRRQILREKASETRTKSTRPEEAGIRAHAIT